MLYAVWEQQRQPQRFYPKRKATDTYYTHRDRNRDIVRTDRSVDDPAPNRHHPSYYLTIHAVNSFYSSSIEYNTIRPASYVPPLYATIDSSAGLLWTGASCWCWWCSSARGATCTAAAQNACSLSQATTSSCCLRSLSYFFFCSSYYTFTSSQHQHQRLHFVSWNMRKQKNTKHHVSTHKRGFASYMFLG